MIKPSDLREQAEHLISQGEMSSLEELLEHIAKARQKYHTEINKDKTGASVLSGQ